MDSHNIYKPSTQFTVGKSNSPNLCKQYTRFAVVTTAMCVSGLLMLGASILKGDMRLVQVVRVRFDYRNVCMRLVEVGKTRFDYLKVEMRLVVSFDMNTALVQTRYHDDR